MTRHRHRRPPPLVGTRRDLVLRAFVAVVVFVGLAAAAALLATRGGVDGASVTPPPSGSEHPPVGREDAAQATPSRESVSTRPRKRPNRGLSRPGRSSPRML